ncbi:platelet-activating factor acetylhydrolase precursor [Cordyceps javanica]|uniref:Putative phospholipase n=1 Tax=Cordyceps javanica TaxID=43265 RepID=A0A545V1Q1_9HYPO|nr:platelet-activating factor acetylhydrolase precursor [Cordyceps javanica]TQW07160.1 platelet-activating factor acetylhydrolase precursor [Cordyceps javanica]
MADANPSSNTSRLAAYLAKLNPVPAFPEYTGPYKVGTMDVEIPVTDLPSPSPAPANAAAAGIETVQYRVFYPAVPESAEKRISWLPAPQRNHVSAYTQFVGINQMLAGVLSFIPRHLHYTTIPVHKNAKLLPAAADNGNDNKRWPTMIFSHGLGGNRTSYSYIAGSLASHGVVVFCPEHRDGSAVVTYIRLKDQMSRFFTANTRREVPYNRISHVVSPEVYEAREDQLRIRLWEMGLVHEAVQAMDSGEPFTNLNLSTPSLDQFAGALDVKRPGSIIFAGHSFGAATVYQLLKSTYYADVPAVAAMERPLFTPAKDSSIRRQITENNVTMLLDMWCLPLLAPNSAPLYDLPLPVYADTSSAPGGTGLLAVESEVFFKWKEHLHVKARLLSPDPTTKVVGPQTFETESGMKHVEPNFFYVVNSAHLSQSDFGILFPFLTKKIFDAEQPERALRLNLRAQLQLLRANGIPVARTYSGDLVDGSHVDAKLGAKLDASKSSKDHDAAAERGLAHPADGILDDKAIFDRSGSDVVDNWAWIDVIGLGDAGEDATGKSVAEQVEDGEEVIKGELDPSEQPLPVTVAPIAVVNAAA